jgi:hypothetical protein
VVKEGIGFTEETNYDHFNLWMLKYGYLHKSLSAYTYDELPKLITQLEKVEKDYLEKI